jgi:hypothetical protein
MKTPLCSLRSHGYSVSYMWGRLIARNECVGTFMVMALPRVTESSAMPVHREIP